MKFDDAVAELRAPGPGLIFHCTLPNLHHIASLNTSDEEGSVKRCDVVMGPNNSLVHGNFKLVMLG